MINIANNISKSIIGVDCPQVPDLFSGFGH